MLNKLRKSRFIASILISSILFISVQPTVSASLVSTSEIVAEQQSNIERDTLIQAFERDDVQAILVSKGVDIEMAKLRVASMTDQEIKVLNEKMDALPAGSSAVGTIGFILVVLLITDLIGWTDVYSFIN